ncbi:hypothetical protein [Comamonas terrigena]|jgi:hypothetical protein|uniref:hypothetical protein n=1 Tax=Comamonas terrigena TaxID=32013 RepID=UPI00235283D8|nr:hypothetical protein [Comamonas terrigena]
MEPFGRQPPRFVPTLTDVVPEGLPLAKPAQQEPVLEDRLDTPGLPSESAAGMPAGSEDVPQAGAQPAAGSVSEPVLTSFAPAGTAGMSVPAQRDPVLVEPPADWLGGEADAVAGGYADMPLVLDLPEPAAEPASVSAWDAAALHEMLVERILARVQPQLEAHLREVVADVVSMHAQAMSRSLHAAVEDVVQHAVADAITQEQIQAQLGIQSPL